MACFFSYSIMRKDKPHKITKPQVIGTSVPLYSCPIIDARIKDNIEDDAPIIADAIPAKIPIITHCIWLLLLTLKTCPISPKAGKMASMDNATIDISNAMSKANSRKWIWDFGMSTTIRCVSRASLTLFWL